MKKIILALMLTGATTAMAQSANKVYTMKVEKNDGTVIEHAVNDVKEITFSEQEVLLAFGDIEAADFSYKGETKEFPVNANIAFTAECSNPNATVTVAGNKVNVTMPYATAIYEKEYTLTLKAADSTLGLADATTTIRQESPVTKESGVAENDRLTASDGNARVKTKDSYKYGTFEWTFSEVNLESGYFTINNWAGDLFYMLRFGADMHQAGAGGFITANDTRKINFGRTDGWDGGWSVVYQFDEGTYPSPADMKKLKVIMEPTDKKVGSYPIISRKVYINDALVCDDSTWGGDIWAASNAPGFNYLFGIEGGTGTITIDSFEYTPYQAQ